MAQTAYGEQSRGTPSGRRFHPLRLVVSWL